MEFRILGPLEVSEGGRVFPLPGGKARALLSILLLHANEVVSTDRLIDELWRDEPPQKAANALYVYVSELRKALAAGKTADESREILLTRRPGYLLRADPGNLDHERFERLVHIGRAALAANDPAAAADTLREALSLWRGSALADVAPELGPQPELARLEEERLLAIGERVEADLMLGLHHELVGELEALVAEHPLRERLRGMLMLALYRCGRQADALSLYRRTRRELVEELGIEPSPELQRLHKAILEQDPALSPPSPPALAEHLLPRADKQESRRTVTVLHADLAASLATASELDPEVRGDVLSRGLESVSVEIKRHGGTVESLPGEALLGVFGIPRLHEDDALRAVRAAVHAREALAAMSAEIEADRRLRLEVSIGVGTGKVMTAGMLPISAAPVSVARRLAQVVQPGEIALDAPTELLVRHAVQARPAAPASDGTWLVSEVLEGAPAVAPRFETPMIGRDAELAELGRAFEEAVRDRNPYLVTVLGEAGIGKSRLAHELRSVLAGDTTLLTGRCLSYGEGITLWPLAEVVAQIAVDDPRAGIAELVAGDENARAIADRIAGALGVEHPAPGGEETFWAVRKLFEALARQKPLTVVFEDVHWAEPTFLDLVEHIGDQSRDAPILLLCLARPELLERRPSWGQDKPNAGMIVLGPLSREESVELTAGESSLDDRAREQVIETAEGNPLFIEQMLAMLADERWSPDKPTVPPTIQVLLAARLDRLERRERAVLEQASVAGKEFWRGAVCELVPEELRTELMAYLHALIRKGLVGPADSSFVEDDGFRFRHQLIRDAAYESLPKRERAESHERFAAWLEQAAAGRAREYEEIIGYHLEQAYQYRAELGLIDERASNVATQASERLAASGRRAYNREDMPAAVNLLSRAASLMPEQSRARAELLADLGEALRETGDLRRADDTMGNAIDAAAALADRGLEWRTRVARLVIQRRLHPEIKVERLESEAKHARDVLTELGDDRGLAATFEMLAYIQWDQCQAAEAEKALRRSMEHARKAGARRAETRSLNFLLGTGVQGPLAVDEAIRRCTAVLQRQLERQSEATADRALAALKAMRGEFGDARELIARSRAIFEDLGLRYLGAAATYEYGTVELLAGDPEAAEWELRRGHQVLEQIGEAAEFASVSALLAEALYARGRYSEALRFCEVSQAAASGYDLLAQIGWRGPRAKVLARHGRTRKAEALAAEAVALVEQSDFLNHHGDALMDLAEVQRLAMKSVEAAKTANEAVRLYERKGNVVSAARGKVFLRTLDREAREARHASAGGPS